MTTLIMITTQNLVDVRQRLPEPHGSRVVCRVRSLLPRPSFIFLHYAYFLITITICAVLLWATGRPFRSLSFTDALFLSASAMTEAGLNTVNLSTLNTFQQSVLFVLIMIGSAIFVSAFIVYVRLKAFEKEFSSHMREKIQQEKPNQRAMQVDEHRSSSTLDSSELAIPRNETKQSGTFEREVDSEETIKLYPTVSARISRNSQFHGLTIAERRQLGGNEYRAVSFLSFLVPIYFMAWQLIGVVSLGAWVANHRANITRENGLNPWWVGAFNAVSAFNNSGMSLLDANMVCSALSTL